MMKKSKTKLRKNEKNKKRRKGNKSLGIDSLCDN